MPFISREQINAEVRAESDREYKSELRSALLNPFLSDEQRQDIRARLGRIGQPRVYSATSAPLPGAIKTSPNQ